VPIVTISCDITPKSIEITGWKALNPLKWQYTIPASNPAKVVNVHIMPRDQLQFQAMIGSCIRCMTVYNADEKDTKLAGQFRTDSGHFTLGMLFCHMNKELWAVLVAHAFTHDVRNAGLKNKVSV
jgi:hypothetical protein